jgi:hypothetical protein
LKIKSRAESFSMEIPRDLSNRLTCVGTVWCFFWISCLWGSARQFAMEFLGLKWGKWMIFSVYRISFKKF